MLSYKWRRPAARCYVGTPPVGQCARRFVSHLPCPVKVPGQGRSRHTEHPQPPDGTRAPGTRPRYPIPRPAARGRFGLAQDRGQLCRPARNHPTGRSVHACREHGCASLHGQPCDPTGRRRNAPASLIAPDEVRPDRPQAPRRVSTSVRHSETPNTSVVSGLVRTHTSPGHGNGPQAELAGR